MKRTITLAIIGAGAATPALATTIAVPEPSMLGVVAAGIVGIVVAFRIKARK